MAWLNHHPCQTSFFSTLLDRIYRLIGDGETRNEDMKFYSETMRRKQNMSGFQRACLIKNLMEKKANSNKKHEHDGVLFSSTSISSDSSSGFFFPFLHLILNPCILCDTRRIVSK
ncbi:hypothetical protein HRI_004428500 [Hibiscus trionum]|uniref:Uncharacterized protein n=1 Tax=Hibiscus trionum TaxID=183268 RepID=A0A9W7J3R0_HIBTR|nr:hypothetical protein HRI_004428500 [Hibiscus trionum]